MIRQKTQKFLITIIAAVVPVIAHASSDGDPSQIHLHPEIEQKTPVTPITREAPWTDRLFLLVGLGANSSIYSSNERRTSLGVGSNLRTDVGYRIFNRFAAEISANVTFNQLDRFVIWDTVFTVGARFPLGLTSSESPYRTYGRVFAGRGPGVIIFNGGSTTALNIPHADRIQLDGPVYGFSVGFFRKFESGRVWFGEVSASAHFFQDLVAIHEEKEVPIVIAQSQVTDNSEMQTLHFAVGFLAF